MSTVTTVVGVGRGKWLTLTTLNFSEFLVKENGNCDFGALNTLSDQIDHVDSEFELKKLLRSKLPVIRQFFQNFPKTGFDIGQTFK